ncbi:MAG: 2-(5'-triphosphoribosyl)-3'-dephospho CoA synthase [Desulfuromonas sp.]|uniref:triphosphoribosyl-dephospho-CoA synthase n=1 Tax=Desulfuromonas sp. TaxID=892 RepID=UPI000CC5B0A5|nr:triphosphoribosyl-dephospho-CoA synthase [Desulfuromonas sp.]PLX86050.1 MAG: 2-(5'-triphosphoribosyl)-3'-dephospho CoA synthase [Desulfuromonas sp.]
MTCSRRFALEKLCAALTEGLRKELRLTPKPGLVDLLDSGSHRDLSFFRMLASVKMVGDFFREMASALCAGESLPRLVAIGRDAERRLLAAFGGNTHKGGIFLGGLLLSARARCAGDSPEQLRHAVRAVASEFFAFHAPEGTNGERARRELGASGIRGECLAGLPALFDVAMPAYHQGKQLGFGHEKAALLVMSRLMQSVEDTTALHRCGEAGLARLQDDGRRLEAVLLQGDSPVPLLLHLNADYRRMNLTMGGVADLLGLTFATLDHLEAPSATLSRPVPAVLLAGRPPGAT